MHNTKTMRLAQTAMMIAIATVISLISEFIPFLQLPFGGTFTLASMLPIVIVAYRYGTKWGLFSAFAYSIVQLLIGFKTVTAFFLPGDSQMLVWQAILVCLIDYVVAYTVLGFGGIFRNRIKNPSLALCLGSIVALVLCYIAHIISGAIFFGTWAEWFFTQEGFYQIGQWVMTAFQGNSLAWAYSVFYNGLYMVPEIVITAVVALIAGRLPQIRPTESVNQPA